MLLHPSLTRGAAEFPYLWQRATMTALRSDQFFFTFLSSQTHEVFGGVVRHSLQLPAGPPAAEQTPVINSGLETAT